MSQSADSRANSLFTPITVPRGKPPPIIPVNIQLSIPAAINSVGFATARLDFVGDILGWVLTFQTFDGTIQVNNFELRRGATVASGIAFPAGDPGGEGIEGMNVRFDQTGPSNIAGVDFSASILPDTIKFYPGNFVYLKATRITAAAAAAIVNGIVRVARRKDSL